MDFFLVLLTSNVQQLHQPFYIATLTRSSAVADRPSVKFVQATFAYMIVSLEPYLQSNMVVVVSQELLPIVSTVMQAWYTKV